ncbi:zinc finger CCHC domain-containing protein 3 [Heteronotia binoei]|uniref:zinc finger CCHC domain-containing protein 3 n=1 Tax=Heteronotia binoei TaxID=13085 RepID=UPI002930074A|nr:zinc finger CCHC domain-containing protein 3 [Heteronotia binoei]
MELDDSFAVWPRPEVEPDFLSRAAQTDALMLGGTGMEEDEEPDATEEHASVEHPVAKRQKLERGDIIEDQSNKEIVIQLDITDQEWEQIVAKEVTGNLFIEIGDDLYEVELQRDAQWETIPERQSETVSGKDTEVKEQWAPRKTVTKRAKGFWPSTDSREKKIQARWEVQKNSEMEEGLQLLISDNLTDMDLLKFWAFLVNHLDVSEVLVGKLEKRSKDQLIQYMDKARELLVPLFTNKVTKDSKTRKTLAQAKSLTINIIDHFIRGRKVRTSKGKYPTWVSEEAFLAFLKQMIHYWTEASQGGDGPPIFNQPGDRESAISKQYFVDWCVCAMAHLKVRIQKKWTIQQEEPKTPKMLQMTKRSTNGRMEIRCGTNAEDSMERIENEQENQYTDQEVQQMHKELNLYMGPPQMGEGLIDQNMSFKNPKASVTYGRSISDWKMTVREFVMENSKQSCELRGSEDTKKDKATCVSVSKIKLKQCSQMVKEASKGEKIGGWVDKSEVRQTVTKYTAAPLCSIPKNIVIPMQELDKGDWSLKGIRPKQDERTEIPSLKHQREQLRKCQPMRWRDCREQEKQQRDESNEMVGKGAQPSGISTVTCAPTHTTFYANNSERLEKRISKHGTQRIDEVIQVDESIIPSSCAISQAIEQAQQRSREEQNIMSKTQNQSMSSANIVARAGGRKIGASQPLGTVLEHTQECIEDEELLESYLQSVGEEEAYNSKNRYIIRLRYTGTDAHKLTRNYIVDVILFGLLDVSKGDILAVIMPPGKNEVDICLTSELAYQRFWSRCQAAPKGKSQILNDYEVIPLFQSETKVLTISFRTTEVPAEDLTVWLDRYCRILLPPQKKRDRRGIWTGEYRAIVALERTPGNTLKHLPKYFFTGANQGIIRYKGQPPSCYQCGGYNHVRVNCRTPLCSICGSKGHPSTQCKEGITCTLCMKQVHMYALCSEAPMNNKYPKAYERPLNSKTNVGQINRRYLSNTITPTAEKSSSKLID